MNTNEEKEEGICLPALGDHVPDLWSPELSKALRDRFCGSRKRTPRTLTRLMQQHRENERHRHHGLNATIREISKRIPGFEESAKETKIVKLQRIINYICHMEQKIQELCEELGIGLDFKNLFLSPHINPNVKKVHVSPKVPLDSLPSDLILPLKSRSGRRYGRAQPYHSYPGKLGPHVSKHPQQNSHQTGGAAGGGGKDDLEWLDISPLPSPDTLSPEDCDQMLSSLNLQNLDGNISNQQKVKTETAEGALGSGLEHTYARALTSPSMTSIVDGAPSQIVPDIKRCPDSDDDDEDGKVPEMEALPWSKVIDRSWYKKKHAVANSDWDRVESAHASGGLQSETDSETETVDIRNRENPGVHTSQISKYMGLDWRRLTAEEQQPYRDQAREYVRDHLVPFLPEQQKAEFIRREDTKLVEEFRDEDLEQVYNEAVGQLDDTFNDAKVPENENYRIQAEKKVIRQGGDEQVELVPEPISVEVGSLGDEQHVPIYHP